MIDNILNSKTWSRGACQVIKYAYFTKQQCELPVLEENLMISNVNQHIWLCNSLPTIFLIYQTGLLWFTLIVFVGGRSVFWALFGAIYLCYGMREVYRVLFEVFGMDLEAEDCQPKLRRQLEDVDYVSVEVESQKLSWQDVGAYKASISSLPSLFYFFELIYY